MSRWLVQCFLLILSRSLPTWVLVCILPVVAGAESAPPPQAARHPVMDGMSLIRQGIAGNMCALTFDDGPSQYTSQLLDTLKAHGIKATFFVVGSQVKRRPELIRRMIEEGHEVGNHSYSHNTLRRQSAKEQEADLRKLDVLLRELGANPRFVRPPYGFYDHNTVNVVRDMDGRLVMWTADSQDWRKSDNLENALSNMRMIYTGAPMRGVFLFHDTHRLTVERMPQILETLAATGCRFVTLTEYVDTPLSTVPAVASLATPAVAPVATPVAASVTTPVVPPATTALMPLHEIEQDKTLTAESASAIPTPFIPAPLAVVAAELFAPGRASIFASISDCFAQLLSPPPTPLTVQSALLFSR